MDDGDMMNRILGAALVVPPGKPIDQYAGKSIEDLADRIRKRFDESGRQSFAENACMKTGELGWGVPCGDMSADPLETRGVDECVDAVLNSDYENYPDEAVQEVLEYLRGLVEKAPDRHAVPN